MWERIKRLLFGQKKVPKERVPLTEDERLLVESLKKGDRSRTEKLLKRGVNANAIFGHDLLGVFDIFSHTYSYMGIQLLLKHGLNVNLCDQRKETLFEVAIVNCYTTMFDLLLTSSVDPNIVTSEEKSLIYFAAKHTLPKSYSGIEFVEKLLERGGRDIKLRKKEFKKLSQSKVKGFQNDRINGRKELAKYLVMLAHQQ